MDLGLIKPNDELDKHLKQARESDNNYRWLLIMIDRQKCQMILENKFMKKSNDWKNDYQQFYKQLNRDDNRPFFLLVHLNSDGINWLLIHMSPPKSDVKQKMVAASTKATLKNSFGSPLITMDLFIEDFNELMVDKIYEQIQSKQNDKKQVQTIQELEIQKQQEMEVMHKIEHCNLGRTGGALHFNCLIDQNAENELKNLKEGNYCCLRFVMSHDFSKVIYDGKLTKEDYPLLSKRFDYKNNNEHEQLLLPEYFQPGYIVFRFRHFNPIDDYGETEERFIMISYVPSDNTLPAKLRFSYSVNLNSMFEKMNDKLDNNVKYFECGSLDDVTVLRCFYLLYPSLDVDKQMKNFQHQQHNEMAPPLKFEKPASRGRGPRRIIR